MANCFGSRELAGLEKFGGILLDPKLYSKVLLEFLIHRTFDCFSLTLSNQLRGMRACKFFRTMLYRQVRLLTMV